MAGRDQVHWYARRDVEFPLCRVDRVENLMALSTGCQTHWIRLSKSQDTQTDVKEPSAKADQIKQQQVEDTTFKTLATQLGQLESMMSNITQTLSDLVSEIEELQSEVEWVSVVGTVTEFQFRVASAIDTALDVHIYDPGEIQAWAQQTCDLATGLSYYLYGIHRLIVGDTAVGKPLMQLYFQLCKKDSEEPSSMVARFARFFGVLVALQSQGFIVLTKAHNYLGLPAIDYTQELILRIERQT
ncbi:hypothetical protein BBP40_006108 [Aspergillus hancockii]|nr:hypothetical protein BBP40_006108 [Aspergillus hancockii]